MLRLMRQTALLTLEQPATPPVRHWLNQLLQFSASCQTWASGTGRKAPSWCTHSCQASRNWASCSRCRHLPHRHCQRRQKDPLHQKHPPLCHRKRQSPSNGSARHRFWRPCRPRLQPELWRRRHGLGGPKLRQARGSGSAREPEQRRGRWVHVQMIAGLLTAHQRAPTARPTPLLQPLLALWTAVMQQLTPRTHLQRTTRARTRETETKLRRHRCQSQCLNPTRRPILRLRGFAPWCLVETKRKASAML